MLHLTICGPICWFCAFDAHFEPPKAHPWADEGEIREIGPHIAQEPCGCPCAHPRPVAETSA